MKVRYFYFYKIGSTDLVFHYLKIKIMKKLSLEMLRLSTDEVLGRSQMKSILGGSSLESNCLIRCIPGQPNGTSVNDCTRNTMNFYCPEDQYPEATCNCTAGSIG